MDIAAINSTPKYRTIIVDDEPPALAKLSYLLKDYEDFELVARSITPMMPWNPSGRCSLRWPSLISPCPGAMAWNWPRTFSPGFQIR